ncbi:hypothetical protein VP01_300g2 [Puccinia sorghi]|uniref:Uncharacterized protein n=1 Tax=Puccinia sorghi TaxID=27349 RepID=A0A0L6V082_9BASI|nr:hypothetical protein VP01_300g2 [Puccinia sorghi]
MYFRPTSQNLPTAYSRNWCESTFMQVPWKQPLWKEEGKNMVWLKGKSRVLMLMLFSTCNREGIPVIVEINVTYFGDSHRGGLTNGVIWITVVPQDLWKSLQDDKNTKPRCGEFILNNPGELGNKAQRSRALNIFNVHTEVLMGFSVMSMVCSRISQRTLIDHVIFTASISQCVMGSEQCYLIEAVFYWVEVSKGFILCAYCIDDIGSYYCEVISKVRQNLAKCNNTFQGQTKLGNIKLRFLLRVLGILGENLKLLIIYQLLNKTDLTMIKSKKASLWHDWIWRYYQTFSKVSEFQLPVCCGDFIGKGIPAGLGLSRCCC